MHFAGVSQFHFIAFCRVRLNLNWGETDRRGRGMMGVYYSIKTTVKVVVTTEQRVDSSDQELLVSSTLLSTEDRARVFLYNAPIHVTTCSIPVLKQCCSCYWQSCLDLWRWHFSSPDDDDLFQLRWWRFYLQWRHLCPGWIGNTLWELHFHLTDSGRFHHNTCCVHLKLTLMGFFLIRMRYSFT